jgi:hypothetical protein
MLAWETSCTSLPGSLAPNKNSDLAFSSHIENIIVQFNTPDKTPAKSLGILCKKAKF